MDIRIGVTQTPKELAIEVADESDRDALIASIDAAITNGAGVLWLTDKKGKRVGIAAAKISYIEIGTAESERRIGFGA